jgi:hypothetical protein
MKILKKTQNGVLNAVQLVTWPVIVQTHHVYARVTFVLSLVTMGEIVRINCVGSVSNRGTSREIAPSLLTTMKK